MIFVVNLVELEQCINCSCCRPSCHHVSPSFLSPVQSSELFLSIHLSVYNACSYTVLLIWLFFFSMAPYFQWREILMLQHTTVSLTIVCSQLCGKRLKKALSCYNMKISHVHKTRSVIKRFSALNTFGMSCNAECQPGLNSTASVPDVANAPVAEWEQISASRLQNHVGRIPRRVEHSVLIIAWPVLDFVTDIGTWELKKI